MNTSTKRVVELLSNTWANFGNRSCVVTSFQKSGMVLLDLCRRHEIPFPVIFVNTGVLFPETVEFAYDIAQSWGFTLIEASPTNADATAQRFMFGEKPWEKDADMCCRIRKVKPLKRALEPYQAWVSAIRRDQGETRKDTSMFSFDAESRLKVCPLVLWKKSDVDEYTRVNHVPQQTLYGQGYGTIGCWPCTTPLHPGESEREGRWRGCSKTECGIHE